MSERSEVRAGSEAAADVVRQAEREAGGKDLAACLKTPRRASLDCFAALVFGMPDPRRPALSALLPSMPAEQVQRTVVYLTPA